MKPTNQGVLERWIGDRLKAARLQAGLSQAELARRAGVDRPNVVRLERGDHVPSLAVLWRVAEALGLSVPHLLMSFVEPPKDEGDEVVEIRNYTGWAPVWRMGPNGTTGDPIPREKMCFYGGPDGMIVTNDGGFNAREFRLSDLPRPKAGVKLLVRPEVYRFIREHSERTDVTDGNPL